EFLISDSLSSDTGQSNVETLRVSDFLITDFAMVETEGLFVKVTKQMKWLNTNVGSFESTLQKTPEVLDAVSVDFPIHVGFGVVNNLVNVIFVQSPVALAIIGVEIRTIFNVVSHECLQSVALAIFKNHSANFAATLKNPADYDFVGYAIGLSR